MMNSYTRTLRLFFGIFCFTFSSSVLYGLIDRPLRILVVETYFPPVTSTAALNQIKRLIQDGHTVHIYAVNKGSMEWAHPDVATYNLMDHVVGKPSVANLGTYDVIYCMFGYRGKDIIDLIGNRKLPNTKIVVCFRGADITKYLQKRPKHFYRKLFTKSARCLPVCHYFEKKLRALGCKADKITVVPSTIDCSFFAYRESIPAAGETIKLVSVSRLTKKKGLEYAIRAVAELVKKYPHIEYKIAGFGTLQKKLQQLIVSLQMQDHIKLVGRLTQEGVRDLLTESHIFVLPSITDKSGDQEGIPNSLKEAMAVGLPVVSTYHAGIPELVADGISGFLVPEQDMEGLAERIEYLITNVEAWRPLSQAARRTVERNYEYEAVNARLTPLLYSLVNKPVTKKKSKKRPIEY